MQCSCRPERLHCLYKIFMWLEANFQLSKYNNIKKSFGAWTARISVFRKALMTITWSAFTALFANNQLKKYIWVIIWVFTEKCMSFSKYSVLRCMICHNWLAGSATPKMQLITSAELRAVSACMNCRQVTELTYFI